MSDKKTVLVTGCSRGIGLEIAKASINKGWRVVGTARKSKFPEEIGSSENFRGAHVDLGSVDEMREIIKPLLEEEAPEVLINNAGIFTDAGMEDSDDKWLDVWNRTMDVNLLSSSLLSKWFLQQNVENGRGGIIINVSSRAAYRGDTQEYAAYAASKAGMVAFTKSIARDYSRKGILAYSIAPGFIETDMASDAVELLGKDHLLKGSAFDEITQPDEVAEMVTFLAQGTLPHASGQTFHINGGSYFI